MIETKIPEFRNGCEIRGCNDWEEVAKWVNGLSPSNSMGVVNEMIVCPKKPRFYFHSPFAQPALACFQGHS